VRGAALVEALVLAVDVAATVGSAQVAPMRFFRPAMCGALGASLGLAKLAGLPRDGMVDALGIAYSQLAGTMQAHLEGSPMLALQVGLAARAAVTALDLARAGFSGPRDVIEGPFGYFELFDASLAPRRAQVESVFDELGRVWRIAEVSHKPFPTGRAAHGALDGLATLQAQHGFTAAQVQRVELAAPPLILRLVGRPLQPGMDVNYARLCLPYLAATFLLHGRVGLQDFSRDALDDPARHALGARVVAVPNDCTDPNALAPQTLRVTLADGHIHRIDLPAVLGHPDRPLSLAAQRTKFDACCAHAGLSSEAAARLHIACWQLPQADDVAAWVKLMNESP
jgi:2-methylcitrate dehydratase PrpD